MSNPLQVIQSRLRARYELARARMQVRQFLDYEVIGRYCGLLLFPFVVYVCVGKMHSYSTNQIQEHLSQRKRSA